MAHGERAQRNGNARTKQEYWSGRPMDGHTPSPANKRLTHRIERARADDELHRLRCEAETERLRPDDNPFRMADEDRSTADWYDYLHEISDAPEDSHHLRRRP